jgi:hypothetical protein
MSSTSRVAAALALFCSVGCFERSPASAGDSGEEALDTSEPFETAEACDADADGDGSCAVDDCNDADANVFPGAAESCNGEDDDCDGTVDEGVSSVYYADEDDDGYGDPTPIHACEPPSGAADNGADCDDANVDVHPGAEERANGKDDDCDGEIDEGITVADLEISLAWSRSGVKITLTNGSGAYDFGMAETGVGDPGWYGESCVLGEEPWGMPDYGYDVCHTLSSTGGTVIGVRNVSDVADGTTIFTESIHDAGNITYVLFSESTGDCWAWGHDASYYDEFGCAEL